MNLSTAILGTATVNKLQARTSAPVLVIGEDSFTRKQLAKIDCFNFAAAARLTHLISTELKIKNTADLFKNVKPIALAIPGLGSISLATVGAAFEVMGIGTLADWVDHHDGEKVTFDTMKHHATRDAKAEQRTKRAARDRRETRKRTAHELRVTRHLTRAQRTH